MIHIYIHEIGFDNRVNSIVLIYLKIICRLYFQAQFGDPQREPVLLLPIYPAGNNPQSLT